MEDESREGGVPGGASRGFGGRVWRAKKLKCSPNASRKDKGVEGHKP